MNSIDIAHDVARRHKKSLRWQSRRRYGRKFLLAGLMFIGMACFFVAAIVVMGR